MCLEKKLIVSVIVPVYNLAPFLADCVESLMDQGLSEDEYEVIFIDDGSTDASLAILQRYAEKHPCMKVVHQENAGVSAARNKGLDLATGEYIAFVDGDDFLKTGALKVLCDEAVSVNADNVVFGYLQVEENIHYEKTQCNSFVFENNKPGNPIVSTLIWNQLVKRAILEDGGIRFQHGMKYGEDTWFAFDMAINVNPDKQISTDARVYCCRQRSGSAMHTNRNQRTPQLIRDVLRLIDYYGKCLGENRNLSTWMKGYIKKQIYMLSANIAINSLRCEVVDPYQSLKELTLRGVYPYPFTLDHLKRKLSIGNLLVTLLCFPVVFHFFAKTKLLSNR